MEYNENFLFLRQIMFVQIHTLVPNMNLSKVFQCTDQKDPQVNERTREKIDIQTQKKKTGERKKTYSQINSNCMG